MNNDIKSYLSSFKIKPPSHAAELPPAQDNLNLRIQETITGNKRKAEEEEEQEMVPQSIERKKWSAEEDERLNSAVNDEGAKISWLRVAEKVQTRRNVDCRWRWINSLNNKTRRPWTIEEDTKLRNAVQQFGKNWVKISESVGKTDHQCCVRWTQFLRSGIVQGVWNQAEKDKLAYAVNLYGTDWKVVAELVGRTAEQCRQKWEVVLNPNIKKGYWSKEEDKQLWALAAQHGRMWSIIANAMNNGRTRIQCSNRYVKLSTYIEKYSYVLQQNNNNTTPNPVAEDLMIAFDKFYNTEFNNNSVQDPSDEF